MSYEQIPKLREALKARVKHSNDAGSRAASDIRAVLTATGSPFILLQLKKTSIEGHFAPHRSVAVGVAINRTLCASHEGVSPVFDMDEIKEMADGVTTWSLLYSALDLDTRFAVQNEGKIRFKVGTGFHDDPARMLASNIISDPYFLEDIKGLAKDEGLYLLRIDEEDSDRINLIGLEVD